MGLITSPLRGFGFWGDRNDGLKPIATFLGRCAAEGLRHRWRLCSGNGYLHGSYRIATALEVNSRRLASFKSRGFDRLANNVGPLPACLGRIMKLHGELVLVDQSQRGERLRERYAACE